MPPVPKTFEKTYNQGINGVGKELYSNIGPNLKTRFKFGMREEFVFGGGGGTENKTRNEVYNEVINETIIQNSKSAVMAMTLSQVIDIKDSQNIIIKNFHMKQVGQLDAKVVQDSVTSVDMATKIANNLASKVKTTKGSFNFSGGSSSDTVNIVKNTTHNIFKNIDTQSCVTKANAMQALIITNAKNVAIIDSSMEQVLDIFVECIQKTGVTQKVLNSLFTESELSSTVEEKGVIGEAGEAVGTAAEGVGSGVGTAAEGVGSGVGTAAEGIGTGVGSAGEGIGTGVGTAGEGIGSGVGSALEPIGGAIGGIGSGIGDGLGGIGSGIGSGISTIAIVIGVLMLILILVIAMIYVLRSRSNKNKNKDNIEKLSISSDEN